MSGGNNGKMLTVKLAKILTVSRKSHHPTESLNIVCIFFANRSLSWIGTKLAQYLCENTTRGKYNYVNAESLLCAVSVTTLIVKLNGIFLTCSRC